MTSMLADVSTSCCNSITWWTNKKRKEQTMRECCKLTMVHLHHWFFNLWKYWEGMPYILFKINWIFIVRETWFTKIDNHEMDTNKNILCCVEIQLALLAPEQCAERLRSLRVMLFLNIFFKCKDMRNSFCELI